MKIRKCSGCGKEKSLNKKHFQVVKMFKKGFSFFCLDCDEKSKKPKSLKKKEKEKLKEKVELKLMNKDVAHLVSIIGLYKEYLESFDEYDMSTGNLDELSSKILNQLEDYN